MKKLHVLIGHWTYEGEYKPGPLGGGSKVKGVWDARMILGGFFLHEEVNEKVDAGRVARARHRIIRPCKQGVHHELVPVGWEQILGSVDDHGKHCYLGGPVGSWRKTLSVQGDIRMHGRFHEWDV